MLSLGHGGAERGAPINTEWGSLHSDNDYGHPSPVLLNEMARLGVPLLRTDRDGDVAVVAHDGAVSTVVHGTAAR